MANPKKEKSYSEAEIIDTFGLVRNIGNQNLFLQEWITQNTVLTATEVELFEDIYADAVQNISTWQEEDLKMMFISFVLRLGHLRNQPKYYTYFEKTISATVEGVFLKTKTDFMIAQGILNMPKTPYFHFQEYKPEKNATGDSMGQLLEALLIAHEHNKNENPIYGCEINGAIWKFVVLHKKEYFVSKPYNVIEKTDLLTVIATLRKFKEILETKLLIAN